MKLFLITFLICFVLFGIIGILFGWSRSPQFLHQKTFLGLIPSTIIAAIVAIAISLNVSADVKNWNDGHCPECSIEWELFDVEKYRRSTTYFYKCPECGKVIETNSNME